MCKRGASHVVIQRVVPMGRNRTTGFWGLACCLVASAAWLALAGEGANLQPPTVAQLRRPVAAAFLADGHTLCVANERSGTLSLVDVRRWTLAGELSVGQHLTSLATL